MVMQWKEQPNGEYHATWQGTGFVLWENPLTARWELYANGKHVTQTWRSLSEAKRQIDYKQERLIMANVRASSVAGGVLVLA